MHMKLNFKRLMAMFLSIMMVVGMMPTMVFAEDAVVETPTYVAKVNDTECSDATALVSALKTASGEVTVEVYDKITTGGISLNNSNITKLSFIGKNTDAEICVDGVAYIDVRSTSYPIEYTDLILSHTNGSYGIDGRLQEYFSTYSAGNMTYTNCSFPNGVTALGSRNATTVTFNNCTFNNTTSGKYSLWVDGNGTNVVVNGGTFCGVRGAKLFAENGSAFSTLNVTGATFSDTITEKAAVVLTRGESVALTSNTFNNNTEKVQVDDDYASEIEGKTVTIDSTEYKVDSEELKLEEATPAVTYVAEIGTQGFETLAAAFEAAQNGDEVKILTAGTYSLAGISGKNITVTGTVEGVEFTDIGAFNMGSASVTFNNVTFTYAENSTYKGLQHSGDLVYNDCTFNGQVFLYGTSETFKNCVFNTEDSNNYNVWTYGAKKVEFNGCTFNSAGKSVLVYNEGACATELEVVDTEFIASKEVEGKAAIEIDTSKMPSGTKITVDAVTTATGFATGSVSGNSLWNDKKADDSQPNGGTTSVVVVAGETVKDSIDNVTYVAQVGENKYTDLQEAIVAAAPNGTVEITADVTVETWKMFWQGDSTFENIIYIDMDGLTINGNGHTLTVNNIVSSGNGNQLFKEAKELNVNDLTIKVVNGTGGIGLQSGTISNVTFDGGTYGVLPGTGEVTIEDCTFKTNGTSIYFEGDRDDLVVTGNKFENADGQYAILLRGDVEFTNNTITTGKVNVVNGSPVVTGNDFGEERFKVYNEATATIEDNTINNLVFNDATATKSTFSDNTMSDAAQAALAAVTPAPAVTGTITGGMVNIEDPNEYFISTEIKNLKASESVVVKLYSGETHIATTTLQKNEYFNAATLSVKIIITGTSSSWETVWEEGKLSAGYVPNKVVLYVDGTEMNSAEVKMIKTNGETAINWADVVPASPVAQIGSITYTSLQDAINAAQAGDTITFLADITEDVTIDKNLTIDGGNFKYTGKMDLKNVSVTIQNVNFVKGQINKDNNGTSEKVTINNCTFDGQGLNGYAVNLYSTNYIVIEDCTAKNYGYGFLQVPSSNVSVSVKNVEISDGAYGIKIDYSNGVTLENVDITASQAAVLNSNYGEKQITIKNSKINIYGTWNRNNTTKTTVVFEGENTVGEFTIVEAIDVFKLAADATLTAPEGLNVTTDVDGYEVVYEDGVYKVVAITYVAQIGETKYTSLKTALEACTNGETVKLIADITYTEDDVVSAHGGATGFGKYDQYNPSIIYIGGTKGATEAENQPSNVNAVLDLNGHTIKNNADAYLFLIMDNAKVTFKDSVGSGAVIGTSEDYPVIWACGTDTLVTIESGKYTTANDEGLLWSTHAGDLVITGGEFSTTADDASLLIMLNSQEYNNPNYFLVGVATVNISGGTFYGFNPEKVGDDYGASSIEDIKFVDGCADGYVAKENGNGTYVVETQLLATIETEIMSGVWGTTEITVENWAYLIAALGANTNLPVEVTLNSDIVLTETLVVAGTSKKTIDLNGHTVSMSVDATEDSALITNNGTLTIKDSGTNGKLTYVSSNVSTSYSTSTIINNGTLTVESGIIENTSARGGAAYAIDSYNTLTVNGGKITATNTTAIRQVQSGSNDNTVTVAGGTISGGYAGMQVHVLSNAKKITTEITGGAFEGNYAFYTTFYNVVDSSNTEITVNGGTFDGDVYLYNGNKGSTNLKASITGGTFNGETYVYTKDADGNQVPVKAISGGTFANDVNAYCADGYKAEESNGTWTVKKVEEVEPVGVITSTGHSISLEGNILINKYATFEGFEGIDLTKDAGLLIWTSEISEDDAVYGSQVILKEGLLFSQTTSDGKSEYGQSTDGIVAPKYGDKLYMRFYVKVGDHYEYGAFTVYSVEDYCRNKIENSSNESLKKLCAAVLNYGAQAQIKFNHNPDDLVNEGIDGNLATAFSENMIIALDETFTTQITASDNVTSNGRSISLDEGITINYYYKASGFTVATAELLTWSNVEGELTYENADKTAMIYTGTEYGERGALVPVAECGETIYACARFTDAEGNVYYSTVEAYSAHQYASNQINKGNNVELLKAFIVYSNLAKQHFNK